MTKTIKALEDLRDAIESEIKDEPDDFNWSMMYQLRESTGRALWHMTRGETGIPNNLELKVL